MSSAARLRSRMQFFQQRCAECGLAHTHQRQVLYRVLAESDDHLSPEALYEKVKSEIPEISLGTIYRNIRIFKDCGLLQEVTPLHEAIRLDPNLAHHHHLVCRSCRMIVDIPAEDIEPVQFRKPPAIGFTVEQYEILGLCSQCATKTETGCAVTNLTIPDTGEPSWEK